MKHLIGFKVFKGPGNARPSASPPVGPDMFDDDVARAFEQEELLTYDDLLADKKAAADDDAILASVMAKSAPVEGAKRLPLAPEKTRKTESGVRWTLPGFEGKCRVSTSFGDLPIEALRVRDKVKCLSGGYAEVKWIDAIRLDVDFMIRHNEAHPIMIRARALGGNFPTNNMLVSPAQTIVIPDASGESRSVLAAELEGHPNIMRIHKNETTYYRFHVGTPEQVCIEGSWFFVSPED